MMSVTATAGGKSKLSQNAAAGGPKSLVLMSHSETHDWNTMMAQSLQDWTAFMGTPEKVVY